MGTLGVALRTRLHTHLRGPSAPGACNRGRHCRGAAGACLLLPTVFTLTYASLYHQAAHGMGLSFPGAGDAFRPDYGDFLCFAFTIAVAAQTADVIVTASPMRRLVLLESVLSFAFNSAILALTINMAASLF
jgi:uncharacterized membrane protein